MQNSSEQRIHPRRDPVGFIRQLQRKFVRQAVEALLCEALLQEELRHTEGDAVDAGLDPLQRSANIDEEVHKSSDEKDEEELRAKSNLSDKEEEEPEERFLQASIREEDEEFRKRQT